MKQFRAPIAGLMAVVVAVANNLAVMRSYDTNSPYSLPHFLFACGILPMASLLILLALMSTVDVQRGRLLAPFLVGFEVAGWAAVFAFLTYYSIATASALRTMETLAAWIRPLLVTHLQTSPIWLPMILEFGFAKLLFTLPQLLLALLGGWLARRINNHDAV